MKFLVTGVAGFLGSHVAERLINLGHEVSGIDNLMGGYLDNIPLGVDFYNKDLLHYEDLEDVFNNCEVVIHAACTAYEGLSVFSPAFVTANTSQITANALSWSIRSGVKKFIHMSSMARYGSQSVIPFTENMVPMPQDPYGIAKLAAEKLVQNLCEIHGMDYVILIPHNIIGPRQKYDDPYRNVASIMINRMLQGKQPIIYGDGEQLRCFSFIDDVVEPIVLSCFSKSASKQLINIGPDNENVSINVLASTLAQILNFKLNSIYVPGRPQEVRLAVCSSDKARKILNFEPKVDLKSGLFTLIEWIKSKGVRPFVYDKQIEISSNITPKTWTEELI